MEIIIVCLGSLFLIIGLIGCVLPIIPGPPFSLLSLLLLEFTTYNLDLTILILIIFLVILVTFVDYWLQVYGVKRFGGQKKATYGAIIGLFLGLIFVSLFPLLIIIGPFLGAYIGAKMEKTKKSKPIKIALGALIGFLGGSIIKICTCIFITIVFFNQLFDLYKC